MVDAFETPRDYVEHFRGKYGPTIAAEANAEKNGQKEELERALVDFVEEWNRGGEDGARFEQEYLVVVATRK